MGKFAKTNVGEEDGIVKQAVNSLLSPKPYKKYLDTVATRGYSLPLRSLTSIFSTPVNLGGVFPTPPDLLYVAEGYVENGYV